MTENPIELQRSDHLALDHDNHSTSESLANSLNSSINEHHEEQHLTTRIMNDQETNGAERITHELDALSIVDERVSRGVGVSGSLSGGYHLRVASYNCKDLSRKHIYPNQLLERADCLFLQETWQREQHVAEQLMNKDYRVYHKSAMSEETTNRRAGRPHGGIAWVIKKSLARHARVQFKSERVSTCVIGDICMIGVYMPYNKNSTESEVEYEAILAEIFELISENDPKILLLGDFNSDLYRLKGFDDILRNGIETEKLICIDCLFTQKVGYTYKNNKQAKITRRSHDNK
jgi:hypothetical protein